MRSRPAGKWALCFELLLLSLIVAPVPAAAAAAPFKLTIEPRAVAIEGVTAKGAVALIGVARGIAADEFPEVRLYREWLVDEDGDGKVRFEATTPFPARTLFIAAEGSTGETQAATLAPFGLRRVPWRGQGIRPGAIGKIHDQRVIALVLLVRPGVGGWAAVVADGRDEDEDGAVDSGLEIAADKLERLEAVAGPPPPIAFLPTDLVALIDPVSLEFTIVRAGNGGNP